MKVLYDHQIFDTQVTGGISRYIYELISFFNEDKTVEWELPIKYSNNEYLKRLPYYQDKLLPMLVKNNYYNEFFLRKNFKGKNLLHKFKNKLFPEESMDISFKINRKKSIEKIKEGNFDVFHPSYYDNYFLEYINNKPFVLTVHDLIHQIFPEYGLYENRDKNLEMLNKANKIITVSKSTKSDLIDIFNVREDKVEVIYLANSLDTKLDNVSKEFRDKVPSSYLLYVGNRDNYKNFMFFAQMFSSLRAELKDIFIVCTGSSFNDAEKYLFNKLGLNNQVVSIYVNDEELSFLYKHAIALVFPSLYEGFGLPLLEAFSCGCPVIASSSSSLLEIGGNAVIYFEPKKPSSMLNALKSVFYDKNLIENKIKMGYAQLAKFSWENTAIKTKRVYEDVLKSIN